MKTSQVLTRPAYRLGNLIGAVRSVTQRQLGWARTADLVADRLRRHLPTADILTPGQRDGDPLTYISHLLHVERSEEHTSELQSRFDLVCRLLLEKKKKIII